MAKDKRDDIDKLFDYLDGLSEDGPNPAMRAGRAIARRTLSALERIATSLERIADNTAAIDPSNR